MKQNENTIEVVIVDKDKIASTVKTDAEFKMPDNTFGFIDGKYPMLLISEDCIGSIFDKDNIVKIDVYEPDRKEGDVVYMSMFPCGRIHVNLETVKSCLTQTKMNLKEYMAGRFGYNGRIRNNVSEVVKYINSGK